jgi:hypothetical protein
MKYKQINKKTKEVENIITWDGVSDISFILENCDIELIEGNIIDYEELENITPQYVLQRVREYPPLSDFADAYYWVQKGDETKMNEYIAKCEEVKNKYPKPQ